MLHIWKDKQSWNSFTSWALVLTMSTECSILNATILLFAAISSANHIFPRFFDEIKGSTIVKVLYSFMLAALQSHNFLSMLTVIVGLITLCGYFGFVPRHVEKKCGHYRQYLVFMNICMSGSLDTVWPVILLLIVSKTIYFWERQSRHGNGTPWDFSWSHSIEHLSELVYVWYLKTPHDFFFKLDVFSTIFFLVSYLLIVVLPTFKFICWYTNKNLQSRIPSWFDTSSGYLLERLKNKSHANLWSIKVLNLVKVWDKVLANQVMFWNDIDEMIDISVNKIPEEDLNFDVVVGILSGGAFIANQVKNKIYEKQTNKQKQMKVEYWVSKMWSGLTFWENVKQKCQQMFGGNNVIHPKLSQPLNKDFNVEGKNVLLVDDTISSGATMKRTKEIIETKFKAKKVEVLVLIQSPRDEKPQIQADYFCHNQQVPVAWEWGVEMD